jgi:hypothetical protein
MSRYGPPPVCPSDCPYSDSPIRCPYWTLTRQGWVHDRSGVAGFDENVIQSDTDEIESQLPKTPRPRMKVPPETPRPKDDYEGPGKFSIFPKRRK